jgi:hypothetical protein
MKKVITTFLSLFFLISCREVSSSSEYTPDANSPTNVENTVANAVDTTNFTKIEWIDPIDQQLGKLTPNKEVEITWNFKNAGNKPLIIENVSASCGCTIPEKPEKPLAPGEAGFIKAKFNGSGMGIIVKQVHVTANTTPAKDHTLSFGGEIIEKK